jgi:hypothetical protein
MNSPFPSFPLSVAAAAAGDRDGAAEHGVGRVERGGDGGGAAHRRPALLRARGHARSLPHCTGAPVVAAAAVDERRAAAVQTVESGGHGGGGA